ncbi:MAG: GspE/PulE family protein, partial [Planctomycetia bacterium]
DGILHNSEPFDRTSGDAILNVVKVLSAMDITEKRKPQDGSFGADLSGQKLDFRVATSGSSSGEKMVIRILDASSTGFGLDKLGMSKKIQKQIRDVTNQPYGLFLCCGPTGAGKSTTLYSCMFELDRFTKNVITIEDPVEYTMESITQIEINSKGGQTFAGSLRSILRQDPDVILIGEIRDKETADISCQAAQTGHMVFSTVHANDSIGGVFRLLDLNADPGNLGTSLSAILAQRLVRTLCEQCREVYKPSLDTLKKAGLEGVQLDQLHRPPKDAAQPCPKCGGLGYFGRTGVFELLTVNDAMREMIRQRASLKEFRGEARKSGTEFLFEYGVKLCVAGRTSLAELTRVVK